MTKKIYLFVSFTLLSITIKAQNYGLVFNNNIYMNITNSANLVIDNPNASAITVLNTGNIISEGENNVVKWNIGVNTGIYKIPFTTSLASGLVKIPLEMNITTAGTSTGTVIFSTYETTNDDNTTYPSDVVNMNSNCNNNNGLFAVDRFWRIDAQNYTTKPSPVISFGYNPNANETGVTNTITQSALKAERFNATAVSWETPQKLYGLANTTSSVVAGITVLPADFYKSWTLIDTTIMTFTVSALSQSICAGTNAILTPTGGTTYTLMPNNISTNTSFSVSPTITTSYTISGTLGTGTATCKSLQATNATPMVNINALPVIAITGNSVICSGNTATLSVSTADMYSWDNGTNTSQNIVSPITNTAYTAVGTNTYASGNCTATAVFSVNVNATPTVAVSGTSVVCNGNGITINANTATTYLWDNGSTTSANTFTPSASATYSVVGTNTYVAGNCSSLPSTFSVTVNANPTVSIISNTMCAGNSAVLTASANPSIGSTYLWSQGSITTNTISVNPTTNTDFTVTATNNGCSGFAVATATVYAIGSPTTGFSYASPICIADVNPLPTPVTGFASSGIYTATGGLTINSSTGEINLSASTAGTYVVTYSVSTNGCTSSGSSASTIIVQGVPSTSVASFSFNSPICKDNNSTTTSVVVGGSYNGGQYSASPAGLIINLSTGEIDVANSLAGTYTVNYAYTGVVTCSQTYTGQTTVTITASPTITASSDVAINVGSSAALTATSSPNTYTWFPTTNLSCTNCDNPTASPTVTTNYCVKTVDGVCTNSVCLKVIVENPCPTNNLLALPNAFSPNGDGNNDLYCFQGWSCVSAFTIMIFDRWGEKVFETTDPSICWDGSYKGKSLDPAVFVYYAKATFNGGITAEKKGNITLIK